MTPRPNRSGLHTAVRNEASVRELGHPTWEIVRTPVAEHATEIERRLLAQGWQPFGVHRGMLLLTRVAVPSNDEMVRRLR